MSGGYNPFNTSPELAPAVVFCVLYFIVSVYATSVFIARLSLTFLYTLMFCLARVLSYAFRAKVSQDASEAWEITSGIFTAFGLLLLVNVLIHVLARVTIILEKYEVSIVGPRMTRIVVLFIRLSPLAVSAASAISAAGAAKLASDSDASDINEDQHLRKAGAIIYLVCVVILLIIFIIRYQTIQIIRRTLPPQDYADLNLCERVLLYVAIPATAILIPRVIWSVASVYNTSNADFIGDQGFYPMFAMTEFLSVCIILNPLTLQYLIDIDVKQSHDDMKAQKSASQVVSTTDAATTAA